MSSMIRAVVLGGGGYVGGELLRLIAAHPHFELAAAVSDSRAGTPIGGTFGHLAQTLSEHSFVAQDGWLSTYMSSIRRLTFAMPGKVITKACTGPNTAHRNCWVSLSVPYPSTWVPQTCRTWVIPAASPRQCCSPRCRS